MRSTSGRNLSLIKFINPEFNKFIFFGVANTVLGYVIYVILVFFLAYPVAYTIAYVSGIFISYYLNSRFVFKREMRLTKAMQYPVVYIVQYVLGISLLYLLVELCRINKVIAPVLIIIVTVPVTFLLSRFIIKGRVDDYKVS